MEKISLSNLAEALAVKSRISREAASNFMHSFIKTIEKGLQENGMVKVKGLGTFKLLEVSERSSVDVNTGERIIIKGYRKVTFTPDSAMKEFVNRPFAHFEPTELNEGYPDEESPILEESNSYETDDVISEEDTAEIVVEPISADTPIEEEPVVDRLIEEDSSTDSPMLEPVTSDGFVAAETTEPSNSSESSENTESSGEPATTDCETTELSLQPKKETKERRGCLKWILIFLLLVSILAFVLYWLAIPMSTSEISRKDVTLEQNAIKVKPNLNEELGAEWGNEHIANGQLPANEDSVVVDSVHTKEQQSENVADPIAPEHGFHITDSLLAKNLKEITPADTTDYTMEGTLAVHKLKSGETIIQLANKYYGEKRLWPYIVAYNRMERFNSVDIGQEILIPCLKNK